MPDDTIPLINTFLGGVPMEQRLRFIAETKKRADERAEQKNEAVERFLDTSGTISGSESILKGAFSSIISDVRSFFPNMLKDGFKAIVDDLKGSLVKNIADDMAYAARDGVLSEDAGKAILGLADKNPILAYLMSLGLYLTSYLSYYGHMTKAAQSEAIQGINAKFHPNLFGPTELIRACFISPADTPKVRALMERLGYKPEHIDLLFKSNYTTYTIDQTYRLWLRGVLDDAGLTKRLRENGLTDERIEELSKLYKEVPPVSDIIFMLGKEAFEEDQVAKFGLDAEYPPEAERYAAMHGLEPFWTRKYWRAHWNHASPGQVLEMLHRGYLTEEDVFQYYRVVEIPPYWREKLMQISYSPYTRVDTRRMYELGIVDEKAVYQNYRDLGYDHEKALNMTRFSVASKIEKERDLTVAEVMGGLKYKLLAEADVKTFLLEMGYSDAEAEFKIGYALYKEELGEKTDAINLIGEQYKAAFIDGEDARRALRVLTVPESEIDKYLARWGVSYARTRRKPTKAELDKFAMNGIITAEQYIYELTNLGYSDKVVAWFLDLLMVEMGGS